MKLSSLALTTLALSAFTLCRADAFKAPPVLSNPIQSAIFSSNVDANYALAFGHFDTTLTIFSDGKFYQLGGAWNSQGFFDVSNDGKNARLPGLIGSGKNSGWGWNWPHSSYSGGGGRGPVSYVSPANPTQQVPDGGLTLALVGLGLVCLALLGGRSQRIVLA